MPVFFLFTMGGEKYSVQMYTEDMLGGGGRRISEKDKREERLYCNRQTALDWANGEARLETPNDKVPTLPTTTIHTKKMKHFLLLNYL